jgi:hypothetical protein
MTASRWIAVSVVIGLVYYVVERRVLGNQPERSIVTDVWQGIVVGGVLGFITAQILARVWAVKVNGWITMFGCGLPGNGMLFRTACAQIFPGPVNVPQEAMYWTTSKDGAGHKLNGRRHYVMHFPPGGLAPNADGSVDIYIQNTTATGHDSNWLPAPAANFILWLRVYMPAAAILDGTYKLPPLVEVDG